MSDLDDLVKLRPHLEYARDIIDGHIVANKHVINACNRSINEHMADVLGTNPDSRWTYRQEFATAVIIFATKIPHIKGELAQRGKTFQLPPWQEFFVSEIYGWRDKRDQFDYIRRFRRSYLEVAKKNGKSSLAAILALYETKYGDYGGEIYSAASTGDQGKILWAIAQGMLKASAYLKSKQVSSTSEHIISDRGTFKHLNTAGGAAANLDGLNPSFLIFDEAANIEDSDVIAKPSYGQIARKNAMRLMITHAQYKTDTIYYQEKADVIKSLEGTRPIESIDRSFGLFYGVDDVKDIDDEKNWIKANPCLDEAIGTEELRDFVQVAVDSGNQQDRKDLYTYHFCVWLSSASSWLEAGAIQNCIIKKKKMPKAENVCIGLDLALRQDLSALAIIKPMGKNWYVDFKCWTTQRYVDTIPKDLKTLYEEAEESGVLVIQHQESIDLKEIQRYIKKIRKKYNILAIGYDPNQASNLASKLDKKGYKAISISQQASVLNEITREVEARIYNRSFRFDGNPFIIWQFSNAVQHVDRRDLVKILKPTNQKHYKIDAVDAFISGAATVHGASRPETGGIATVHLL